MKHPILRALTALVLMLALTQCSKETGERLSDGGYEDDSSALEDGRSKRTEDEEPGAPKLKRGGGKSVSYCGYQFEGAESSEFSRAIEGRWIEASGNTCTTHTDASGEYYCTKSGFEFDMHRSLFGEMTYKYKSVLDVAPKRPFDITSPTYNAIKFSKIGRAHV